MSTPSPAPALPTWCNLSLPATLTRILSIQSTVTFGYVGNKAATFPLQLLGFDVDPIHSCQFSNHTGYGQWKGNKTDGEVLKDILTGLGALRVCNINNNNDGDAKANNTYNYHALLTGYMSNESFLTTWTTLLPQLIQGPLYLCDPVMGDNNTLYVPQSFVSIYNNDIIPRAHIITPNQTEGELLAGMKMSNIEEAINVCRWFHTNKNIPVVIITSMIPPSHEDPSYIYIIASIHGVSNVLVYKLKKIEGYFSGTGDLTSALILGWILKEQQQRTGSEGGSLVDYCYSLKRKKEINSKGYDPLESLSIVMRNTLTSVQGVITRTKQAGASELLLIQSKKELEEPVWKGKEGGIEEIVWKGGQ